MNHLTISIPKVDKENCQVVKMENRQLTKLTGKFHFQDPNLRKTLVKKTLIWYVRETFEQAYEYRYQFLDKVHEQPVRVDNETGDSSVQKGI